METSDYETLYKEENCIGRGNFGKFSQDINQ